MPAVTGRVGYAANTLLFYVKGGGAWMHIEHIQDVHWRAASPPAPKPSAMNRTGFVAGVGIEYALTENLSALFEYDFYDFGTKTDQASSATPVYDPLRSAHSDVRPQLPLHLGPYGQPFCPTC